MASSTPEIPQTMRAWSYSRPGKHRDIVALNRIPSPPPPKNDEVLIKVAYSGLNPGDVKVMWLFPSFLRPKNSVPGQDYSGIIIARGPKAPSEFSIGLKVFGMLDMAALFKGRGTLCEYVVQSAKTGVIIPVPQGTEMEGAGTLGTAANMALQEASRGGIDERNAPGMRILVNGASGGCGSMFVQVVTAMGCKEVVGVCSGPNLELVQSLGAKRAIDYTKVSPLHEFLAEEYADRPFDFILDTVGDQRLYTNSPKYLTQAGIFMNIGDFTLGTARTMVNWILNYTWPTWLGGTPRRFVMFSGDPKYGSTGEIVKYLEEGKVKAVVDSSVRFEDALDGLDRVVTRRVRGRVVVKVGDD